MQHPHGPHQHVAEVLGQRIYQTTPNHERFEIRVHCMFYVSVRRGMLVSLRAKAYSSSSVPVVSGVRAAIRFGTTCRGRLPFRRHSLARKCEGGGRT